MEYKNYNDYELLNYIYEGNEEANNIIIKKYEPLITKIAIRMLPYCKNNGLELSDLIQEGMIGLNHAIEKYHELENSLFFTYAKTCIRRKMISVVIASNRKKNRVLNESISYDDEENLLIKFIKDTTPNPEEAIIDIEKENMLIENIKKELTDFENEVFILLISGFKYSEIAEILEKDKKSINNAMQRIRQKLKNKLL